MTPELVLLSTRVYGTRWKGHKAFHSRSLWKCKISWTALAEVIPITCDKLRREKDLFVQVEMDHKSHVPSRTIKRCVRNQASLSTMLWHNSHKFKILQPFPHHYSFLFFCRFLTCPCGQAFILIALTKDSLEGKFTLLGSPLE